MITPSSLKHFHPLSSNTKLTCLSGIIGVSWIETEARVGAPRPGAFHLLSLAHNGLPLTRYNPKISGNVKSINYEKTCPKTISR